MMHYLFENFIVAYVTSLVAILTLVLTVIIPALNPLFSGRRKFGVSLLASIILSIPTAIISGNLYNRDNRQDAIAALGEIQKELIVKKAETDEYWSNSGVGADYPAEVPWPLLLSEDELSDLIFRLRQIRATRQRYFTPTVSDYIAEAQSVIVAPHVGTFTVKCSSLGPATVSVSQVPPIFEAWCSDGMKGKVVPKHSFSHKQLSLLECYIELLLDRMKEECALGFYPAIREKRQSLKMKLPFSDTKAWIMRGEAAKKEIAKRGLQYYPALVEGLSLLITGRADRGANALAETIDSIISGQIVRPANDELVLVACALMYKHYKYLLPENKDHTDAKLASRYMDIGRELGGDSFSRIIEEMERYDYGDPDFTWHYRNSANTSKKINVDDVGGSGVIGTAIVW